MNEHPPESKLVQTNEGPAMQHYLPGCSPAEMNAQVRPAVQQCALLLQHMLRRHALSRAEAMVAMERALHTLGRS